MDLQESLTFKVQISTTHGAKSLPTGNTVAPVGWDIKERIQKALEGHYKANCLPLDVDVSLLPSPHDQLKEAFLNNCSGAEAIRVGNYFIDMHKDLKLDDNIIIDHTFHEEMGRIILTMDDLQGLVFRDATNVFVIGGYAVRFYHKRMGL